MSDFITVNSTVFDSWFETIKGKELVNIKRLAEAFDKEEKHCVEIVLNARELFKGEHFEFSRQNREKSDIPLITKQRRGRPQKDHYLTRDGCLAFLNRLDYNRYDPDVSKFIIEFQKWLIKTAGKVIDGKLIPSEVKPLTWSVVRNLSKNNHRLCMDYVKKYEAHIGRWRNPREPYQRESRAINEDVIGVHIRDLSNKLNASGLQIKNDAYVADMALMEAGVPFERRHPIIKHTLNTTYQSRIFEDILLSPSERVRMKRGLPESQTGISDFVAVSV